MSTSSKPESQQQKGALQSKFLAGLPAEDREHVLKLTKQLAGTVGQWTADYPVMRKVRVPQVSMTLAAATARNPTAADPFSDLAHLLPCVRLALWIFVLDDLSDEEEKAWERSRTWTRRSERCLALLEGSQGQGNAQAAGWDDPMIRSLAAIREELAHLPRFSAIEPDWRRSMRMQVDSMEREQVWSIRYSRNNLLPTYAEYLENGLWSIGVVPILFGSLMGMAEEDVAARASSLSTRERPRLADVRELRRIGVKKPGLSEETPPRLTELEIEAATCVRLANDLRSYEKEVAEGKLNALTILQRKFKGEGLKPAAALERARTEVQEEIKRRLGRMMNELLSPQPRPSELFRLRLAGFACDFYVHHDYDHSVAQSTG